MAVASETVWAIDIGNSSLKALRLSTESGRLEVVGFDNIRHGKIISGENITETEKEELVAFSLRQFVNKHDLSMDEIIISVPSQNSFARFVNLPPVEAKRVPEIVKFEAVQQIPFDINEVQWDWQRMSDEDSAEMKVGIFAIKNEIVNGAIEHFMREDIQVGFVQMAPMALYNYILHDRPDLVSSDSRATIVLNIGAEITDLVVCTKSAVWQRCILIGGNNFTKAIADTFRLNFEKAEKLKRTAPVSKYARQIFQAMRPVFTDLASEVQRSLGFYKSSNPKVKIGKIVALGGATRLRGLLKYLQQTLQMPVERPDTFKRLSVGQGVPAAKFGENVTEFGVVYGLGVQGLGLGGIESNLLPSNMVRSMEWAGKSRWFVAAACMLLAVSVMALGRTLFDKMSYTRNDPTRTSNSRVLSEVSQASRNLADAEAKIEEYRSAIDKEFEPFKYREIVPLLHETILSALPNAQNNPSQAGLYAAFARGDVEGVTQIPRKQRKQLFVTNMSVRFARDLSTATFDASNTMQAGGSSVRSSPYDEEQAYMREYMRERPGSRDSVYGPSSYGPGAGTVEEAVPEPEAGFVVVISGYSPYENIRELIDPMGVEDQPGRWGFVTRLLHLDDFVPDGNSPFSLYEKTNPDHFSPYIDAVEVGTTSNLPPGVGEPSFRVTQKAAPRTAYGRPEYSSQDSEMVLVDPMTKELISKVPELDANGNPRVVHGSPGRTGHNRDITGF